MSSINNASNEICVICQDLLTNSENGPAETLHQIRGIAHIFHRDCIEPWLAQQRVCPTCRWALSDGAPPVAAILPRSELLNEAIRNYDLDSVDRLLREGAMTEEGRVESVRVAVAFRHLDIVDRLLRDGDAIPESDRGLAVWDAAGRGRLDIVE